MAKEYFLSHTEPGKATAFEQFRDNIPPYVTLFGLAAPDIAQQAHDAAYFRALLTFAGTMSAAGPQWTAWKGAALTGATGAEPAVPTKPAGFPSAVPPGILTRFLALARAVKNHKKYTVPIGEILGLEGAEQAGPDLTAIQPEIEAILTGNHVEISWGWGGQRAFLDMLEIQVDRGDGQGFKLLTYDTTPGYHDTQPFPATPTKWTYKAIYRVGDAQVGVWSKPVSVTVGG